MGVLVLRRVDDRGQFRLFRFDPILLQRSIDDDLVAFVHFLAVSKPVVDADLHRRRVAVEKGNEKDPGARLVLSDVSIAVDVRVVLIDDLHRHFFLEMFGQATAKHGHRPEEIVQDDGELLQGSVVQLPELDDLLLDAVGVIEQHLLSFVRTSEATKELLGKSDESIDAHLRHLAVIGLEDLQRVNLRVLIVLLEIELRALVPALQLDLGKGLLERLRQVEAKFLLLAEDAHETLLPGPCLAEALERTFVQIFLPQWHADLQQPAVRLLQLENLLVIGLQRGAVVQVGLVEKVIDRWWGWNFLRLKEERRSV